MTITKNKVTDLTFNVPSFGQDNLIIRKFKLNNDFINTASSKESNGPITYEIVGSHNVATVSATSGAITMLKAGTVRVYARQAATHDFDSEDKFYTLQIDLGDQDTFDFNEEIKKTSHITFEEDLTLDASAAGGYTDKDVIYSVDNTSRASITENGIVTIKEAGPITITAIKPGDERFDQGKKELTIIIDKADQPVFKFETSDTREITYNDEFNGVKNAYQRTASGGVEKLKEITYSWKEISDDHMVHRPIVSIDEKTGMLTIKKAPQVLKLKELIDKPVFLSTNPYRNNVVFENMLEHSKNQIKYKQIGSHEFGNFDLDPVSGAVSLNSQIPTYEIEATVAGDDCYEDFEFQYSFDVARIAPPVNGYQLLGDKKNDSGWFTGDVLVVPVSGYAISYEDSVSEENWKEEFLSITENGIHDKTIFYKEEEENQISEAETINEVQIDKECPTDLSISYSDSVLDTMLENVSFGFYQAPVTVTLTAKDVCSKPAVFKYHFGDDGNGAEENSEEFVVELKEENFSEDHTTATYQFQIDPEFKNHIVFTAVDTAGNEERLADNKMIVVDSISPNVKITYSGSNVGVYNENHISQPETVFSGKIMGEVRITEHNFYPEDVKLDVYRDGANLTKDAAGEWVSNGDVNTLVLTMESEGVYQVKLDYHDKSNNPMHYELNGSVDTSGSYISGNMAVDKTAPSVVTSVAELSTCSKCCTYSIEVTERHFRPSDVTISIGVHNINGDVIDDNAIASSVKSDLGSWKQWTCVSGDTWRASYTFSRDGIYNVSVSCSDMAGNSRGESCNNNFTIDHAAPNVDDFSITYSTPVFESILENISFGYYKADVKITFTAKDDISGIQSFDWSFQPKDPAKKADDVLDHGTIGLSDIEVLKDKRYATASITLTAEEARQYQGNFVLSATDLAGNKSDSMTDTAKVFILDTISPTSQVELGYAKQVVDADTLDTKQTYDYKSSGNHTILYYDNNVDAHISLTEENFYPEDVKLLVNGQERKDVEWESNGELHKADITLVDEGEYVLELSYMDRSQNQMTKYVSDKIIIDRTNPAIHVNYKLTQPKKLEGKRKYFDQVQSATLRIKEQNFRADDIKAVVTAVDVSGKSVKTMDYTGYLSNRANWKHEKDEYVTTLTFEKDANYTIQIDYMDLAKNAMKQVKDEFTVDTKAPENVKITYSDSIMDTVLEAISFGFYNKEVKVTITATDDTSGVEDFVYSQVNASNTSIANQQLLNKKIEEATIVKSEDHKTATASFTIGKSELGGQFNGTIEINCVDKAANETNRKDDKRIVVDTIAPDANITYNSPAREEEKRCYYPGDINAKIAIKEANFYKDDVEVKVNNETAAVSDWTRRNDLAEGSVNLREDGTYVVDVAYQDKSNNVMQAYHSKELVIDTIRPELILNGIANNSANKGDKIGFVIKSSDINMDFTKFKPVLTVMVQGENGRLEKKTCEFGEMETIESGTAYQYTMPNLNEDGIYTLSCSSTDKVGNETSQLLVSADGNKTEDSIRFSVNRKGSTYAVATNTESLLEDYYVNAVNDDIVIMEVNCDPLQSKVVLLNGRELVEGKDYTVIKDGSDGSWQKYSYCVKKELFKENGKYSLVVSSQDKANNVAYSDIKETEIEFVVDNMAPSVAISGVNSNERYRVKEQVVNIIPKDDLSDIEMLSVIVNDKNNRPIYNEANEDISVRFQQSGEELAKTLEANNGIVTLTIPDGLSMNVSVECTDCAKNLSGKPNVFTKEFTNVTVSSKWYIILYANKKLFYGIIAGTSAGILAIVGWIIYRKKKKARAVSR